MKKIFILLLPLIIAGCSNKIEYVYVEPGLFSFTIHTDIDCKDIDINPNRVRAEDIKSIYAEEVEAKMVIKCCRYCVSDEQYEWLTTLDTIQ